MTLSKKARTAVMIGGLLLVACAVAIWLLPVLGPNNEIVRERVQTREGSAVTTTITQRIDGWEELQSEPISLALLGVGLALILLAILPAGVVTSIPTPFGEMKLNLAQLGNLVGTALENAPTERVPDLVTETVEDMRARGLKGSETTPTEIDETIKRIIEEEEEDEEEEDDIPEI
jgi:hypothetical protein